MIVLEKELYKMTENNIEQINIAGDTRYDSLTNKLSKVIDKKRK